MLSLNKLFEGMSLLLAVDRGLQFAIYNIYCALLWGNPAFPSFLDCVGARRELGRLAVFLFLLCIN